MVGKGTCYCLKRQAILILDIKNRTSCSSYYSQNRPCTYHNTTRHARHHKYLRLVTNCDIKVHGKGNIADGKSQPSPAGNAGEAVSCPRDGPASAGLPEHHCCIPLLSRLHCTLQGHTDIVNSTQANYKKTHQNSEKRKETFLQCCLLI